MKLTADANVLLSSVIGGRARLVFGHPEIVEVFTTEATFAEVRELCNAAWKQEEDRS